MSAKKRKWARFRAANGKVYYMPKRFREGLVGLFMLGEKTTKYYPGQVEGTLLYDRALSPKEIQFLYENPFCMFTQRIWVPLRERISWIDILFWLSIGLLFIVWLLTVISMFA